MVKEPGEPNQKEPKEETPTNFEINLDDLLTPERLAASGRPNKELRKMLDGQPVSELFGALLHIDKLLEEQKIRKEKGEEIPHIDIAGDIYYKEEIKKAIDRRYKKVFDVEGEKLKIGQLVNFDNGNGIEKDWVLKDFNDREIVVGRYFAQGPKDEDKIYTTDAEGKFVTKTISIEKFIEYQSK